MVTVRLPKPIPRNMMRLLPQQRAHVNTLFQKGQALGYTLSADRGTLWIIIQAKDAVEARNIIEAMPMGTFFEYTVEALAFHQMVDLSFPVFSLN